MAELVEQGKGDHAESLVVVVGMGGLEDSEAALDGEAGRNHQHVLGEAGVLGIGDLIQDMPGDDHGHDHGLACSGGHLGAAATEVLSVVAGNLYSHFSTIGGFGEPNQRPHGFKLVKEELAVLELLRVGPMLQ